LHLLQQLQLADETALSAFKAIFATLELRRHMVYIVAVDICSVTDVGNTTII
jgi:hypothetical protein